MVAIREADVSWLSDPNRVAQLDLYTSFPNLLKTVPVKQRFWRDRLLLTLHDVVNVQGILGLMDVEMQEVEFARKEWLNNQGDQKLIMDVRKEAADVVIFAKTYQTFANGSWYKGRSKVLEAVSNATSISSEVGGEIANDVNLVVQTKNHWNYLRHHYDFGWMLAGREAVPDEAVSRVYAVAKKESRKVRDTYGEEGVLPPWLGMAMSLAIRERDRRKLSGWLSDPTVSATVGAMMEIYEVAKTEFSKTR